MAAKKKPDESEREVIFGLLLRQISRQNSNYNPAHENARIDASELILKHADPSRREPVFQFLREVVDNKHASIGAPNVVRACRLLLEYLPNETKENA
jgi:hypothetical protein